MSLEIHQCLQSANFHRLTPGQMKISHSSTSLGLCCYCFESHCFVGAVKAALLPLTYLVPLIQFGQPEVLSRLL